MVARKEIQEIIDHVIIGREDIAYTHPIFMQCFLPHRTPQRGAPPHQVNHGSASLRIRAGELVDPNNPNTFEQCEIPSGVKARLLLTYINHQAYETKNATVNMGKSLREFMVRNGIPIGGKNGREITRQSKNLAAAELILGTWDSERVTQKNVRVAGELSFWLEKDCRQATLWTPELTLSPEYLEILLTRRTPVDFRALVALQSNPRAMDVYCWLAYRLRNPLRTPVHIPYEALHPIFGHGIKHLRNFKVEFSKALKQALKCYPEAQASMERTKLILRSSRPAIAAAAPKRSAVRPGSKPKGKGGYQPATPDNPLVAVLQEEAFKIVSPNDLGPYLELTLPVLVTAGMDQMVFKVLAEAKSEAHNPPGYIRHHLDKLLTDNGLRQNLLSAVS